MSAKEEKQDGQETGARVIGDIPDYRLLAMLALCLFLPMGSLAFLFYFKTVIYKEQNEYEKALLTSKRTFLFALASIIVGFFVLFLFYLLLYRLSQSWNKPSETYNTTT